jgi:phosphatidylserine decarboxylase
MHARHNTNNYKSWLVKLSVWAQAARIPGAETTAAWMTKFAPTVSSKYHPKLVEKFIREYGIDYTQATRCSPTNSVAECAARYGTLDNFFARHIRNIHIADAPLVSPATSKVTAFDTFASSRIWVKGHLWSAPRLLGRPAESFRDYAVGIFRLRPQDYHRFHSPFRGIVTEITRIGGGYLSVDPAVVRSRNVFTENNRVVYTVATALYDTCYVVAVGAAGIGKVNPVVRAGAHVFEGDELGTFDFGGSSIIVLIPSRGRAVWRQDLTTASRRAKETYVRIGEEVGI